MESPRPTDDDVVILQKLTILNGVVTEIDRCRASLDREELLSTETGQRIAWLLQLARALVIDKISKMEVEPRYWIYLRRFNYGLKASGVMGKTLWERH